MKKALRIFGIVIAVLIVLLFALSLIAPKIAKGYIEKHSVEWIGRKVEIESVSFNPFRFSLSVENLSVYEADASKKFFSFGEFFVNVDPSALLTGELRLSEVRLEKFSVKVSKSEGEFNFADILEKVSPADTAKPKAAPDSSEKGVSLPIGISVRNIALVSGNILYEDGDVNSQVAIKDFTVRVPEVYFSNRNTSAGIHLEFVDGGSLGVSAAYNMQNGNFSVNVGLKKFAISVAKPYLKDFVNFKDLSGTLDADLTLSGKTDDVLASAVRGTVHLDSVELTEVSGETIGVVGIDVRLSDVNLNEQRIIVDTVAVRGAHAHFDLQKNSNNIAQLLNVPKKETPAVKDSAKESVAKDSISSARAENPAEKALAPSDSTQKENVLAADSAANEKTAQPEIRLGHFSLSDTRFTLNDYTIPGGFHYTVSGIAVEASDVSLDKRVAVSVRAQMPHGGSAKVTAKLLPADPMSSVEANISVKNVAMKDFSKYSEHYTGYPIVSGALGFASDNSLTNGNIDSRNVIDIYDLNVGDKPSGAKPEYTVPMKIALYVLKDKDEKIAFDVPVKGNLNDPKFSYGKIIWQTVMNLMVKVALSPAKFLLGSSVPNDFAFDMGFDDLTSEQYGIATKWTGVLSSKPGAVLNVVQQYDPNRQTENFAKALCKIAFYQKKSGKSTLTPVDRKAALEQKDSDEEFSQFAASWQAPSKENLVAEMESLAAERNTKLWNVLSTQPGVTPQNTKVRLATPAEQKSAGKSAVFRMQVDLP